MVGSKNKKNNKVFNAFLYLRYYKRICRLNALACSSPPPFIFIYTSTRFENQPRTEIYASLLLSMQKY